MDDFDLTARQKVCCGVRTFQCEGFGFCFIPFGMVSKIEFTHHLLHLVVPALCVNFQPDLFFR